MTDHFAPPSTPPPTPPAANADDLAQLAPLLQTFAASRRGLLLAPLLAALLASLLGEPARAIDPTETQVTLPDQYQWQAWSGAPPRSSETATLF
jgi:hypothetical protein